VTDGGTVNPIGHQQASFIDYEDRNVLVEITAVAPFDSRCADVT
jgi:hypothetical protein